MCVIRSCNKIYSETILNAFALFIQGVTGTIYCVFQYLTLEPELINRAILL